MKVSILIPAYNAAKTIEVCIKSLLPQIHAQKDAEIIVIDSSDDETSKIVQAYSPPVKLIRLKQRSFPGTARNIGIQRALGDILVTIDADCVAHQDFLKRIVGAHQCSRSYTTSALAIGGAILNGHPENLTSWADYLSSASEYFEYSPKRFVQTIGTGNMSYKRKTFSKYGSFPEILRGEDVIFHHRLIQKGEKILFDPSIKVYHLYRTELKELLRREIRYGRLRRQISSLDPIKSRRIIYLPPLFIFYPIVKLFLITKRILRWNRKLLSIFLQALPRLLLVLMATTLGMFLSYFPSKKCK